MRACETAPPENDAQRELLAILLFDRELNAESYADVLGDAGIAAYRNMVEQAWQKLPVLLPGKKEENRSDRFRITSMMESLAKISGDVDGLVAIKARDLSLPYHFLQIAEVLAELYAQRKAFANDQNAKQGCVK